MTDKKQEPEILMPEMSIPEYAKRVGQSNGTIRNQAAKGTLPSVKRGRRRMINTAKIFQENINR